MLRLTVGRQQHIRAVVFDAQGRRVAVLLDADVAPGEHVLAFGIPELPAGVYHVRAEGSAGTATSTVVRMR